MWGVLMTHMNHSIFVAMVVLVAPARAADREMAIRGNWRVIAKCVYFCDGEDIRFFDNGARWRITDDRMNLTDRIGTMSCKFRVDRNATPKKIEIKVLEMTGRRKRFFELLRENPEKPPPPWNRFRYSIHRRIRRGCGTNYDG